jgi:hypothetical protein
MVCKFIPTTHAKHRMIERGISREEATEAILKGAKKKKGNKIYALLKKIEVVYYQKPCNYRIITIYWR